MFFNELRKHWNGGWGRGKKAFARCERSESDTDFRARLFCHETSREWKCFLVYTKILGFYINLHLAFAILFLCHDYHCLCVVVVG